jgi:hypothetical protein
VERVTRRLIKARAAAAGAASGAWFGLFIGILVGLLTSGSAWVGLIIGGLLIGGPGARCPASPDMRPPGADVTFFAQMLTATRYDIVVGGGSAAQARSVLEQARLCLRGALVVGTVPRGRRPRAALGGARPGAGAGSFGRTC